MAEQFVGSPAGRSRCASAPPAGIALVSGQREIEEAIRLVLATAPGRAADAPGIRLRHPRPGLRARQRGTTAGRIQHEVYASLDRWEPRIEVDDVEVHRRATTRACSTSTSATRSAAPTTRAASSSRSTSSRPTTSPTPSSGRATGHRRRPLMALPSPNLDDRRFQQFVDDAKRYIQQRARSGPTTTSPTPASRSSRRSRTWPTRSSTGSTGCPRRTTSRSSTSSGSPSSRPPPPAPTSRSGCPHRRRSRSRSRSAPRSATARTESEEAVVFATERELTVGALRVAPSLRASQPRRGTAVDRTSSSPSGKDVLCFAESPRPGRLHAARALRTPCRTARCADAATAGSTASAWTRGSRRWCGRRGPRTAGSACEVDRDGTGGLNRPGEVDPARSRRARRCPATRAPEAGWLRCRVTEPLPDQPFYTTSPTDPVRRRRSPSAAPPPPSTPRRCTTRRSASPPGCRAQRFRLAHAPVVRRHAAGAAAGRRATTAGRTGEVVRHFAASGPRRPALHRSTPPPARSPSAPRCANPTAPCASTARCRPRAPDPRLRRYRTGGGRAGNVARGAVQVLRTSIPYVSEVVNREAARGGVDGETIEEAKVRGPDHAARRRTAR